MAPLQLRDQTVPAFRLMTVPDACQMELSRDY